MKRKNSIASLLAWLGFVIGSGHAQPVNSAKGSPMLLNNLVQKTVVALITIASSMASFSHAMNVSVSPEKCVIVLPAPVEDTKPPAVLAAQLRKTAAEELRKHLQLVTGQEIGSVTQGKSV